MIFFFKRKKKVKSLKEEYYDRLYEIFEWSEKLKKELHSMEKAKRELMEDLREALRKGDKDRAKLLKAQLEELTEKIMGTKKLIKLIEAERKRLEHEGNYMSAVTALKRIDEAMRANLSILSASLRPQAERVLSRIERTLVYAKSERLPVPDGDALIKTYTEELKMPEEVVEREVVKAEPAFQPPPTPMLVDGMIAKYDFNDIVEKVYKVIELYVNYGMAKKLSVKRIAQHVGVSEEEVRKALEVLEKQGRIRIRRSKG